MVNSGAVCGCYTRTDIVREHLEDTLRICDVSAKGLLALCLVANTWNFVFRFIFSLQYSIIKHQYI